MELDWLERENPDGFASDSADGEPRTVIACTPHPGEAPHRALLRGALVAHLLSSGDAEEMEATTGPKYSSASGSEGGQVHLDLLLEPVEVSLGDSCGEGSGEVRQADQHPLRIGSGRVLPLVRLQENRLVLLTQALEKGAEPAELPERIPHLLTCGECPVCLNATADSFALATDAPEIVTEEAEGDSSETEEHPARYRVPAAVENESEQYRLQCLLDGQLAALEEHAAEHCWGEGEYEAAMLLSMTNYHRRERAPFWREHIRRLEDGPVAWVASRDYAYLEHPQVLTVEQAQSLLNTSAELEAFAAAMKEPAEVEEAPGWYRVRGAQVRLLRARVATDPASGLVIAPSDRAVFCAYEAGLSPQIALDRMESQLNYFRASNPGERVPAELAATGFFGLRVLAVAQGGFGAEPEDSADSEEEAEETPGEFLEVLLQERIRVKDEPHGALLSGIGPGDPVSTATIEAAL